MSDDVLRDGWSAEKLDCLNDTAAPICYGVLKPGPNQADGVIMLRVKDVHGGSVQLDDVYRITPKLDSEFARSRLRPGDVVISVQGSVGRVAIIQQTLTGANISRTLARIRPITKQLTRWIWLALQAPQAQERMGAVIAGTTRDSLNIRDLRELELPVPPVAEQARIVEKVDALLARVNASRDRLGKMPAILKRLRQSVLAAACSGRLTEDWRKRYSDLASPASMLDELRREHEVHGTGRRGNAAAPSDEAHDLDTSELPSTWVVSEAQWLCEPGRPITYGILKPGPHRPDGIPYVRVADFPKSVIKLDDVRRTSPEIADAYRRSMLRAGDVLLSIRGTFGRVCRVPPELDGANITQDTARLTIDARLDPDYVALYLRSPSAQDRMKRAAKGVAVHGVNIGDVRALQIAVPPRQEQLQIAHRVDAFMKLADAIERRVAAATARGDKLMQSILARAFRGELVPTEAELARQEGREYEPAPVLLDRIRSERAASLNNAPKAKRKRRAADPLKDNAAPKARPRASG